MVCPRGLPTYGTYSGVESYRNKPSSLHGFDLKHLSLLSMWLGSIAIRTIYSHLCLFKLLLSFQVDRTIVYTTGYLLTYWTYSVAESYRNKPHSPHGFALKHLSLLSMWLGSIALHTIYSHLVLLKLLLRRVVSRFAEASFTQWSLVCPWLLSVHTYTFETCPVKTVFSAATYGAL